MTSARVGSLLPLGVRSVLVILPSWVGDVCMATAALRTLRSLRPNTEIVAFGRPALAPLIAGLPFVDRFAGGSMRGFGVLGELRRLRRDGYDAVLVLPNSLRSALFTSAVGARHRAGTSRNARGWLLTHATDDPRGLRTATSVYARLVAEWTGTPTAIGPPELATTPSDRQGAASLLGDAATDVPARSWLLINPGANRTDKRWDSSRFSEAARAIAASRIDGLDPERVAVTGAPQEAEICASIARESGALDLCARGISLGSLKGVLERTRLLITNDTGPSHMAAALRAPCLTLFGPTDHRWTPCDYPLERRVIAEPFLGADSLADDHAAHCAINRITIADVVHAARALVERTSSKV